MNSVNHLTSSTPLTSTSPLSSTQDPIDGVRRRAPRSARCRSAALAAGVAGALAAGLWAAVPASAHDQLLSAEPAESTTLETAPEQLQLTFSGNLISGQGIQNLARVTDGQGNQWQDGEAIVTGPTLSAPLCAGMPNGAYDVAFRVVYSDGHSEEKDYSFTVQDPQGPESGVPADGCGVVAAGATDSATSSATATSPASPTTSPATASEASPTAQETTAAPETATEDQSGQDAEGVPGWVWAAGLGGVAVVALGLVVAMRKAKNLS